MYETPEELVALQQLLDESFDRASPHLLSIMEPHRRLGADRLSAELPCPAVLDIATVTARGEPRVSAVDGHFLHGRWHFTTMPGSPKATHLASRPAISAAYTPRDGYGVFCHGTATVLSGPEKRALLEHLAVAYGTAAEDWAEVAGYRIDPHWMTGFAMTDEEMVEIEAHRAELAAAGSWQAEPVEGTEGAKTFRASGDDYDRFMGRYSTLLASEFAEAAGIGAGDEVLDVGCGSGALTAELIERVGPPAVRATDPSESFVAHCRARFGEIDVRLGRAEAIPFDDDTCDRALAQLVLHFVSEPEVAVREMQRVVRVGGTVAACVWDFEAGMEMLRAFWDAALDIDPSAPDEARVLRFGREGEIVALFEQAGLADVVESTLTVASTYADFDELWATFLLGIGPAGAHCVSLPPDQQEAVRASMWRGLGSPSGEFRLSATARCAVGTVT